MPLTATSPSSRYSKRLPTSDDYSSGLGQGLQAGGKVRRFADHRLLLRGAFPDQFAYDDQPSGDPDARLELDGSDLKARDSFDRAKPRPHCPLGVVFVRLRVTEIDQDAIAHVPGNKAAGLGNYRSDRAVIRGDDFAQILEL